MNRICTECSGVFVRENGTERHTKFICDDCFISWLEKFIEVLEARGGHEKRMPFLKKLLTKKYIARQEEDLK